MKIFQKLGFTLAFILAFTIFAIAQSEETQSVKTNRIAVVNVDAFGDEKTGIKELVAVYQRRNSEFKPKIYELRLLFDEIQTVRKELFNLKYINDLNTDVNKLLLRSKTDEYERLENQYKRKEEEFSGLYEKRKSEIVKPIMIKIGKELQQFGKEKGYAMVFDISKLKSSFIISDDGKDDLTTEFIQFYNSLSAKQ